MTRIDWLVLTAANDVQARGYQAQLKARARRGVLAESSRWSVIPDPDNRRVGSGGSTLWVLHEISRALLRHQPGARSIRELFAGKRILIIHSGGDSRRLCAYAAQGKIFVPLPCSTSDGYPAALFDLVATGLAGLPAPSRGQVLIAAGDVLLTFDHREIRFDHPGVVGVAYPGPLERGSKHGVYVAARDGHVTDFFQKPDETVARQRHAMDAVGRVLVDTGLISLDPETVERWLDAAGVRFKSGRLSLSPGLMQDLHAGTCPALDLYEQILMAIVPSLDCEAYLQAVTARAAGGRDGVHRRRLIALHRTLHGQPFSVNVLSYCDFFHIGSTRELLSNIGTLNRTARAFGFSNFDRSFVADQASLERTFVYNSILSSPRINAGDGVLLESVECRGDVELEGRNVIVGWPGHAKSPLRLPEGWGMVCLPLRSGARARKRLKTAERWTAVLFGVDDDFKTPLERAGTFGNQALVEFLERFGIDRDSIWPGLPGDRRTLWEARLWVSGPIDRVIADTLWMCRHAAAPKRWRALGRNRRLSMAEILGLLDHDRLLAQRARIQRLGELHHLEERLQGDPWLPAGWVLSILDGKGSAQKAMARIDHLLRLSDALGQARLHKLAHLIHRQYGAILPSQPSLRGDRLERAAFDSVARAVAQQVEIAAEPRPATILHDQVVWVTCPVRIDFAGGWSDTPPICAELGGAVVNAAVTLNGQYPVQVIAKLSNRPAISLNSLDLGQRLIITKTPEACEYQDPREWSALPKAAMILAGLCPADSRQPLRRWLERLGGGLDITMFSALPKGSGLGTSSILGAAMLACMARVIGEPVSTETLIARTSALEQLMTTAGGWQDQVGGITPGVKLIRTHSGANQTPSLHWAVFDLSPGGELQSRLLLYYSGYQRMAKNILQKIVGRYLARDPEAIAIIHQLKEGAEQMKNDLGSGDVEGFARGVQLYWDLKKRLDPGSTNEKIESLLRPLERFLSGKLLTGAGGGGFVFMVARDAEAAQKVRQLLEKNPPNALARFFDFDVDPHGLSVTIL
jgi:fucokinase